MEIRNVKEHLPALLSALVGDAFGAKGWLAGSLAGAGFGIAVQRVLRRRAECARDILLHELRRGEKTLTNPELEEAAAVLLRYGRAAQEGAARLNLRLMAQVIAAQAHQGALYADEFLRHAEILASLRREEVVLLGALQRHWSAPDLAGLPEEQRTKEAGRRIGSELVPSPYPDLTEFAAAKAAVVRTGFLAGAMLANGGMVYTPTRAFRQLCELASLDAALEAEPA